MLFWEHVRVRSGGDAAEVAGDDEGTVDVAMTKELPPIPLRSHLHAHACEQMRQARARRMWTLHARLEQA